MALRVYQSLWATEMRRPGVPERPVEERFGRVRDAGFDGMGVDLGAMDIDAARKLVPEFARTGLEGLLTAFPCSIEDLRPALHLAKDIGSPFVIVVGQVMPLAVADMAEAIRAWLRIADEEELPIQFETHRNAITNDLFSTLLMLDAVPEMRLSADLSHYVVDREMMQPISVEYQSYVGRILERSDSFQGRVANRCQVQLPLSFRSIASGSTRSSTGGAWASPRRAGVRRRIRIAFSSANSGRATTRSPTRTARSCRTAGARRCS